jgi:hypothetical protein
MYILPILLAATTLPYYASSSAINGSKTADAVMMVNGTLVPLSGNQPNFAGESPSTNVTELRSLEADCSDWVSDTEVVGDGSVADWTYWKQITVRMVYILHEEDTTDSAHQANVHCADGTCTVTHSDGTNINVGFDVSRPINRWIDGGLSVSWGYGTGTGRECNAERNEKVCVWSFKHHQAYTVRNVDYPMHSGCGRITRGPETRLTSPLKGNAGQNYWCGRNSACKNLGASEWTKGFYN